MIGELTDPELALCRKDKGRAAELKGKGNACFSKREFEQALGFYSQVDLLCYSFIFLLLPLDCLDCVGDEVMGSDSIGKNECKFRSQK